jgi:reversibly glycosylated polypeptide/UDP-arabinopyranose mutase
MIIVIPTIRNLDFLIEWKEQFKDHKIIVVEDHDKREIKAPEGFNMTIYTRKDIRNDLGFSHWIIPTKSAGIASFGFWKAWQLDEGDIYTLDDDCYPDTNTTLKDHIFNLTQRVTFGWMTSSREPTRGFPYNIRGSAEVVVSHGLWSGLPDYDGVTHLNHPRVSYAPTTTNYIMPRGSYYPMCRMNLAFKRKVTPLMYSLLQGEGQPVNRFEDIWAGVISKKICDHLWMAHINGAPTVKHGKEYDYGGMMRMAITELPGMVENERFWEAVDNVNLTSKTITTCYLELAEKLDLDGEYWKDVKKAMKIWGRLYD